MGALRRLDNLVTINEDASDAPLNDDVLRQIAGSGGARQPEADEASVASRATSAHTVIPTPHGRARMAARAVSMKELQTAKKYGTITRARDDQRDGTARYKIEYNGIVYITDRTQKRVITTYHQIPEEKDARVRLLVRNVRELLAKRSEEENRIEARFKTDDIDELFDGHREATRRLEERLGALESELEEREREKWRDHIQVGDIIDAKDSEGRWFDSRIVEVEKDRGPGEVKVHYNGWSERWDTWVDRKDESIQPHLTHTDDWRRLKVGDAVEMRSAGEKAFWHKGHVREVDGSKVLVESWRTQWLETSSEHICKLGTHIKSERKVGAPPPAPITEPLALRTAAVAWYGPPPPRYERLVAELAEVRVRPSQHALDILRRQEMTVEDLCDLTHPMLVAAGIDQIDVYMIWNKIEVLRNRQIARESC